MTQTIFQSHGFGNIKYVENAGEAANGVIFPCGRLLVADQLPDSNPQKALLVAYATEYEAKFGERASTFGGHAYDSIMIVAKAITDAQVKDSVKALASPEKQQLINSQATIWNHGPVSELPVSQLTGLGLTAD